MFYRILHGKNIDSSENRFYFSFLVTECKYLNFLHQIPKIEYKKSCTFAVFRLRTKIFRKKFCIFSNIQLFLNTLKLFFLGFSRIWWEVENAKKRKVRLFPEQP